MGGPRTRTQDPDFGSFAGGEDQKYGGNKGGGWGGDGPKVDE